LPTVLHSALAATRMRPPIPVAVGNLEVYRENLNHTPRRRVLSRSQVSVDGASLPKHELRRGIALWAAAKSCSKSSAVMTYVPVAQPVDFKSCCMASGKFDGSRRHYFFERVGSYNYAFERPGSLTSRARVRRARLHAPPARLKRLRPAAQRER
jgi:hypothetical protein